MEFINSFISLTITEKTDINDSFCIANQDENFIYITFGLFANDCFFDLKGNNFEFLINISKSYFKKYNEPFFLNVEKQTISGNIQKRLLEIINCKLTGIYRKISLESNILFLLYQSQKKLTSLLKSENLSGYKCIEIEKIKKARTYILQNISKNLTIPLIAINVGTNQAYLKNGFKQVFKQTVFEFIQEVRMTKAKHLLQTVKPNITEIAYNVGYASLSSFSQSYKKYFGITPTQQINELVSEN